MLRRFFYPNSVALIGASRTKGKVGYEILKNLLQGKYKGKVYPVNPKAKKILGKKCFASVLDIAEKIDLAVIMVPAKVVPQVLEECGRKKIQGAIIISAGFKEIGKEGARLEDKIKKIGQKYNIKILGPNCLGVINTKNNLNTSFTSGFPKKGGISFISHSGGAMVALIDWSLKSGLGFNKIISFGNRADLEENEALEYLIADPTTDLILMYLEGFEDGRRFIEIAQRSKKPIIVFKVGKTEEAQQAISSHIGAIAGSKEAVEAALEKAGVIQASNFEEFFALANAFAWQPLLKNNKIAIITNTAGPGIMAVDAVKSQKYNELELARFETKTIKFLKKNLPKAASVNNPVDLLGDALAERYQMAIEAVLKDKNVDGVIVILTPQAMAEKDETAKIIGKLFRKYSNKPILTSFIGGQDIKSALKILAKNKIPNYDYPEVAVEVMKKLKVKSQKSKVKLKIKSKISPRVKSQITDILEKTKREKLRQVETLDAEKILKHYKIPVIKSYLIKNTTEAIKIAKKISYPVVLKIADPKIIHKTEKGGVKLDIKGDKELLLSLRELRHTSKKAIVSSIILQKMITQGQEVIIGMKQDPQFGPLLMFGLGGIFIEVIKDVSFGLAPLSRQEAKEMIFKIKGSRILAGFRGQKSSDINSLVDILVKLSQLSLDFPEIKEIDLNPIKVFEKGKKSVCVDAKVLV
jgi:acetyltransferase